MLVIPAAGLPRGATSFAQLGVEVRRALANAGVTRVVTSVVALPMGRELRVAYRLSSALSRAGVGPQYYIAHHPHLHVVTAASATVPQVQRVARDVVRSWRWT